MLKEKQKSQKKDNHLKPIKGRKFARLGFETEEAKEIVGNLNLLLANYHIHYQKLRNFHWNIRGRDFYELHDVFENLYNSVFEEIDVLAERIRIFGYRPLSTMKEYLDHSKIKEPSGLPTSEEMAKEIVNDFETLLSYMVESIDSAAEFGDVATYNMVQRFIERMEKNHWMLSTWLSNAKPLSMKVK